MRTVTPNSEKTNARRIPRRPLLPLTIDLGGVARLTGIDFRLLIAMRDAGTLGPDPLPIPGVERDRYDRDEICEWIRRRCPNRAAWQRLTRQQRNGGER